MKSICFQKGLVSGEVQSIPTRGLGANSASRMMPYPHAVTLKLDPKGPGYKIEQTLHFGDNFCMISTCFQMSAGFRNPPNQGTGCEQFGLPRAVSNYSKWTAGSATLDQHAVGGKGWLKQAMRR